jgi:REP element-mobilizing transposase RayT
MRPDPHSQNLRLHRLSNTPATFFITKSVLPKKAILDKTAREIIVSAFAFAVQRERIYLRAFVVMPDHWHALFALRQPWTLPKFMHHMMSYVGGKTNALLTSHKTSWQDSYYDTRVKTAKQFQFVSYYIEQNPVVKGLIEKPAEWDASSARRRDLVTDPWPWLLDEH